MYRWILIIMMILPALAIAQIESEPITGAGGGLNADSIKGKSVQDTTGNLNDNDMLRFNETNDQWEYEIVPGAGGGSIDIVWFHNDADDDSISSEGSEIHLKYGVGIDAPILGDTGTVFVDETEFNAMYNNGDTTSGLYDFEMAVFNKVAIGPDTVATSAELLVLSANPIIQIRSETPGGDATLNIYSGDTTGSADQTNSIIRFGAYNAVPTQWSIIRRWSNAGLDDFEITKGNNSMFELWADSAFFLKPLYLGVVTPESLAATVNFAKVAAGDSARVIKLDEVNNPDGDKTFNMGNSTIEFTFVAPSTEAFEIDIAGGFTGHGLHVHQHGGNPGISHLVHIEAVDIDVLPLEVMHAGRDTLAIFRGGLAQFDSIDVNGELRVDANFVMGAANISETEMEILDGATLTTTELNYVTGVNSSIQTQLNGKQAIITDGNALTFTGATLDFDGGATPSGDIGNTWADLVIQPDAVESTMVGADQINELHINFGTGTDQVSIIDIPASNWQVFYSDASGVINELPLGASGEVLKSNGPSSAPSWQTDATGGSPALEDIFAWMSRDYFDSTTALVNDSIIVIFSDSSDISIFDTDDLTEGTTNLYNQTHTGDVTGAIALTIGTDKVNDTHIDWGTGANQVSIIDVPAENWKSFYSNGSGVITELTLGADNTFYQSNGPTAAPTYETVDSTHITDGDLSIDDMNWRYEYIYLKIVHGWARAVEDSSYLTMPVHNGSSSYLLLDYATDITPTHSDTFFVSGEIPFGCSVDTLAYIMQEAGSGGVNDIDFYGPDISDGFNMTDSIYYTNATARTPGATWTIYTENITDIAASAGDRFALRFIVDFAADNDSTLIGWVRLAVRR